MESFKVGEYYWIKGLGVYVCGYENEEFCLYRFWPAEELGIEDNFGRTFYSDHITYTPFTGDKTKYVIPESEMWRFERSVKYVVGNFTTIIASANSYEKAKEIAMQESARNPETKVFIFEAISEVVTEKPKTTVRSVN